MKILHPTCDLVNIKLAYYYMQTIHLKGETHKRFWISEYSQIPFPLPPLNEQKRILAKLEQLLTDLDKGIEYLETTKQQLKVYRQAVLKWAFEGKLFRNKSAKNTMNLKLESLSNLGELICGQSPSKSEVNFEGKGILYVTGPEQWNGKSIIEHKWTEHPKRLVPDNCIFITVKGAGVGKLFPDKACAIGRDIYAFKPKAGVDSKYIALALKSSIDDVIRKAQGDIPGLSKNHILDHEIMFASKMQSKVVSEIESRLSVCDKIEETIESSLQQTEALRLSIIKKAFEGKLVPQDSNDEPAEKLMERIRAAKGNGKLERKVQTKSKLIKEKV